jgi:hypothetical protein
VRCHGAGRSTRDEVIRERLKQAECVQRACDSDRTVVDTGADERAPKHGEIEPRVVRDEHGAVEELAQVAGELDDSWRRGHVLVADAVHRRRLSRDRTGRADKLCEPGRLDAVPVDPHDRERDDLIQTWRRSGRLAVEHDVRSRPRHVRPPLKTPGGTNTGRKRHVPTMSPAADGNLTRV